MAKRVTLFLLTFILVMLIKQTGGLAYQANNVKDSLNYLTTEEVKELQSLIENTKMDYNLDMVVVITDNTQGKSSKDFADDYYDKNGFGVGEDHAGLLMLINMKEREIWISTTGRAIDIFTDSRISAMTAAVTGFLSEGSYDKACTEFVNQVAYYAKSGVPEGQYRTDTEASDTYMSRVFRQMKSILVYVIALVLAIIATIIASLSHKGKITINNQTYEEKGSFQLSDTKDEFIRESTTMVKIQNNNSGNGSGGMGSSTHTGSSGSTHGGGGGKF